MNAKPQKNFFSRFFSSRFFLLASAALALSTAAGFARAYYQQYELRQEILSLQADIDALGKKKLDSIKLLSYVMSPAFAEEKARVELNMKKTGEHVVVVEQPDGAVNSGAAAEDTGQSGGNPIKWWYYFSRNSK